MALHTHGNQPRSYLVKKIGSTVTLTTYNEELVAIDEFDVCIPDNELGVEKSYEPIVLKSLPCNSILISIIDNLFLFLGYYDNIVNNKMPNELGYDWLTVSGTLRNETYKCPDTDQYKNADTDWFWHGEGQVPREVPTSDLVIYDIPRTPVKFSDDLPNHIEIIGILRPGIVLSAEQKNNLFDFLSLSIYWDDSLNEYGHIKNRGVSVTFGHNPWVVV